MLEIASDLARARGCPRDSAAVDRNAVERVHPDTREVRLPTSSKLGVAVLAREIREVVDVPTPAWRLVIADHYVRSPTASPEGTFAAIVLEGDSVVVGVDRGDTREAARFKGTLGPATASFGGPRRSRFEREARRCVHESGRRG